MLARKDFVLISPCAEQCRRRRHKLPLNGLFVRASTLFPEVKPPDIGTVGAGQPLPFSKWTRGREKNVVLVRHGSSTWNEEGRIQGSSNLSHLSATGHEQALLCRAEIGPMKFDHCFASPITRAKTFADIIWEGRSEPITYLDTLKEAHLLVLEGVTNEVAMVQYPELYRTWREEPEKFNIDGIYPVVSLWARAEMAWQAILSSEATDVLVVTHKSILRALICTALTLGPDRFRAVDVGNGGISRVKITSKGEPMLVCLNSTAHMGQ